MTFITRIKYIETVIQETMQTFSEQNMRIVKIYTVNIYDCTRPSCCSYHSVINLKYIKLSCKFYHSKIFQLTNDNYLNSSEGVGFLAIEMSHMICHILIDCIGVEAKKKVQHFT